MICMAQAAITRYAAVMSILRPHAVSILHKCTRSVDYNAAYFVAHFERRFAAR